MLVFFLVIIALAVAIVVTVESRVVRPLLQPPLRIAIEARPAPPVSAPLLPSLPAPRVRLE